MEWYKRDPHWLYPIQDHKGYYLFAGRCERNQQVLLLETGIALFFDADGTLVRREQRELPRAEPYQPAREEDRLQIRKDDNALSQIFEYWSTDAGRRELEHQAHERQRIDQTFFGPWKDEIRFQSGTIQVRRFGQRGEALGITDLPSHYVEFLDNPNDAAFDDDDRAAMPHDIEEWLHNGMYVLWYGRDLWMSGDGKIEST